jgi:hypothetical protein
VDGKFVSAVIFHISTITVQLTILLRIVDNEGKKATEINSILYLDKGLRKAENKFVTKLKLWKEVTEENGLLECEEVSSDTYLNSFRRDEWYCTLKMEARDFYRNVCKCVPV